MSINNQTPTKFIGGIVLPSAATAPVIEGGSLWYQTTNKVSYYSLATNSWVNILSETLAGTTYEPLIAAGTTAQYRRGDKTWQTLNTSVVPEVTNLYYTEARVSANINVVANTAARHSAVTLGTPNGLSLSTQALSLALASTSTTGALSSTDWNTFNGKQAALGYTPYNATNPNGYTSNTGTVTNVTATNNTGQTWTISNSSTTPNLSLALSSAAVGLGNVENKSSATIRSEITSGNVTGALGYTPYNSTNPNGYINDSNVLHIGSDYQEVTGYKRFKADIGADRAIFMGSAANDNPSIGDIIQMSNTNDAATTTAGYAIQLGTGSDLIFNSYNGSPGSISYIPRIRIKNGGTMVYTADPTGYSDFTGNDNAIPTKKYVKDYTKNQIGSSVSLTGSGNGASTTISIAHGLTGIDTDSFVLLTANTAAAATFRYATVDATNVNIFYAVAPPSGSQNLTYSALIKYIQR